VQYNHHDESDPFVLEELHRKLDVKGAAAFEAKASDGTGVLPTLTTISKRVVRQLRENEHAAAAASRAATSARPAPAPARPERLEAPAVAPAPIAPAPARSAPPAPASLRPGADLRATHIFLEPAPDPNPVALDLEDAALSPDVDLLDERDDAIQRAQDLLDPSWSEVSEDLDQPLTSSTPLAPAAESDGWQVVSAERPAIVGAHSVEIPLVIADPTGRELGFRLTVTLTPLLDD
jgi:hypothetical protein